MVQDRAELTIFFTFFPPIIILLYIIFSDRFKEPTYLLILTFFLGYALNLPAGILNEIFIWSQDDPYDYVFLAGFTEETCKFLALFYFIRKRKSFNEPMDGIVYGTLISLGFATLENYDYVYNIYWSESLEVAVLRSYTAIPLHACCGIIMGFYFGLYFLKKSKLLLIKSYVVPVALHSIYNNTDSMLYTVIIVFVTSIICLKLHSNIKSAQKVKIMEKEF